MPKTKKETSYEKKYTENIQKAVNAIQRGMSQLQGCLVCRDQQYNFE